MQLIVYISALSLGLTNAAFICESPGLDAGIREFCRQDFEVPSEYASSGTSWNYYYLGNMNATGTCNPPEIVTQDVCLSRMTEVCTNGGDQGQGKKVVGCQTWTIDEGPVPGTTPETEWLNWDWKRRASWKR